MPGKPEPKKKSSTKVDEMRRKREEAYERTQKQSAAEAGKKPPARKAKD